MQTHENNQHYFQHYLYRTFIVRSKQFKYVLWEIVFTQIQVLAESTSKSQSDAQNPKAIEEPGMGEFTASNEELQWL
jgi:hypothetical protein